VMAPADENECRQMLYTAVTLEAPAAVRYPRGTGPGVMPRAATEALPIGKAELRREGRSGLAILAFGTMVHAVAATAERLDATLVNMRFVKPIDAALLQKVASRHEYLVTVEENVIAGGAGDAVLEELTAQGYVRPVLQLGLPDRFLDPASLAASIDRWWQPRQQRA
jgi:1-deoxy-D-xylulose-5-phosphate synthase